MKVETINQATRILSTREGIVKAMDKKRGPMIENDFDFGAANCEFKMAMVAAKREALLTAGNLYRASAVLIMERMDEKLKSLGVES